jgi:hypothetical protein
MIDPYTREANSVMNETTDHRDAPGGHSRRLRRLRPLALLAAVIAVGVVSVSSGAASHGPALAAPAGLKTFQLQLREARTTFSRTPSFGWRTVRGATRYEFELSTSNNFRAGNSVIWSSKTLTTPAAAVPISLPWITGDPASLYWHVRALSGSRVSRWSTTGRFNMRWPAVRNRTAVTDTIGVPQQLPTERGFVRWTRVEGATGYDVWFTNLGVDGEISLGKIVSTITTVADEREYSTLRAPSSLVHWRVRAHRHLYGAARNGLPRASKGPWSRVYTDLGGAVETTPRPTPLRTVVSDLRTGSRPVHSLMPVFVFSPATGYDLHRVYVATDRDCVNIVHVGSIVGGHAYAPRITGPLALAPEQWDSTHSFLTENESKQQVVDPAKALRSDGDSVTPNETPNMAPSGTGSTSPNSTQKPLPSVDLWDSNARAGRYYWTVVPVVKRGDTYQDIVVPQDACEAKPPLEFAKSSARAVLRAKGGARAPYATGLSPTGRLHSAVNSRSAFYGVPLVAWTPASGAILYDVEWSRTSYPWRRASGIRTGSTSAMLPLSPGTWWYRVRGLNPWLESNHQMSWSNPVRLRIARPTFSVVGGR